MSVAEAIVEELAERIETKVASADFGRDSAFVDRLLPWMELWSKYFDAEVCGFENVPRGGVLVVGNHSGGTCVPDTPALMAAWQRELGADRALVCLAFDALFAVPGLETLMRKLGAIPANPENARCALAAGHAVLVYPGGSHEAFRPWRDRNRIDFAGRQGYVRLALETGVPVVPVVGHGAHETLLVLARGEHIARHPLLKRLRLGVAPLVWQWPWGVSLPLLPGLPLPAKIDVEILEPLYWSDYGPEDAKNPEVVARCDAELRERMQKALTRMAERRPRPLLERIQKLIPLRKTPPRAA